MKMRPPCTPIITVDPYFSVWSERDILQNTTHWTGLPATIRGTVTVDGLPWHFLGLGGEGENMTVESTQIDAFSTTFIYKNDAIRLTVRFTSPMLPDDLYYASRPVTYCHATWEALDGREHTVSVGFSFSEELVLNEKREGRAVPSAVSIPGVTAIRMGNAEQNTLSRSGDLISIDWGYLYLAVAGAGRAEETKLADMAAISIGADLQNEALFLFAYDDIDSIRYLGKNLKAFWRKDGKTIEQAIAEAAGEYDAVLVRCKAFSHKLMGDAREKGSEKYAELLLLSLRQIMAGHKLVVDGNGDVLYISKECGSNGCGATVDITYPSSPMFLRYNTQLLKGMIRPVMRYAASEEWKFDYAPHDVGQYPLLNGQAYGVTRKDGKVEICEYWQMPVEECGNMIILFAAICDADDSGDFALPYMETLEKWSKYLTQYGEDPGNQLCTDDFAGHLAHNVNLSIKAIMGIAGYSRILSRLGRDEEAAERMTIAKTYAADLVERAKNEDGSYRLAYDQPGTFSLKYNAVWDLLWNTKLFPAEFFAGEITRYKKELLPCGVPLDSRKKYTKSDWTAWVACFAQNQEDFDAIVDPMWQAYNATPSRVPMSDWYYCDDGRFREFRHRTVQGGLFMKMLFN